MEENNMKKYILILGILLLEGTFEAYAQTEEKKPTKEETIAWLVKNLKMYAYESDEGNAMYSNQEIRIEDCTLYKSYRTTLEGAAGYIDTELQIPISPIDTIRYVNNFVVLMLKDRGIQRTYNLSFGNTSSSIRRLIVRNTNKDMVERIEKAWNHLAALCKEEEPF